MARHGLAGLSEVGQVQRHVHAAAVTAFARHRERLEQARPDPLAGHLDQAQRGDLGDLVLGPVTGQAFQQPAQHQLTVALQHHVDEVDHDDAAHVAQPQLPDDLLGGLQVVAGNRLLEVPTLAGELAGVHVDDGHRLGAVDDQRAAAGQPHLAVQRLGQLVVDAVLSERVPAVAGVPAAEPLGQMRGHVADVLVDLGPAILTGHDELAEVLVEHVPDDPDGQVRLAVEQLRRAGRLGLALDVLPLRGQPGDVPLQLLLGRALGGGPDDHARVLGHDLLEDLLQAGPLRVRQFAADAGHRRTRHVHQVTTGQAHLAGQPGALVADRVLGHLDQDGLAGFQRRFNPLGVALEPAGVEVHLAGVEHGVAALADVDERRLHGRQHVLHLAEVDVADVGLVARAIHVVLDQDAVLQHGDLGTVPALAHDHGPLDSLAAGQELSLGDNRGPAAPGLAPFASPLPLGLQPGRALDRANVVRGAARGGPGLPDVHHRVRRIVFGAPALGVTAGTAAALAPAAPALRTAVLVVIGLVPVVGVRVVIGGLVARFYVPRARVTAGPALRTAVRLSVAVALGVLTVAAPAASAAPAAPPAPAAAWSLRLGAVLGPVVGLVRPGDSGVSGLPGSGAAAGRGGVCGRRSFGGGLAGPAPAAAAPGSGAAAALVAGVRVRGRSLGLRLGGLAGRAHRHRRGLEQDLRRLEGNRGRHCRRRRALRGRCRRRRRRHRTNWIRRSGRAARCPAPAGPGTYRAMVWST